MVMVQSSAFGSQARTRLLIAIRLLGESYPRELARVCGLHLSAAQKALASLERDGILVARTVGRQRMFTMNPRYYAKTELEAFLLRLTDTDKDLRETIDSLRRRPRRTGKPL